MQDEEFLEDFLKQVRAYQPGLPPSYLLDLVAYEEQILGDSIAERGDHHANFRLSVLYALHKGISLEDRAFLRFLLEQEIIRHKQASGFAHSIHLSGFLLFLLAEVEDVQLLCRAKTTSFDTWYGFDIQLLVGAGVDRTLVYLRRSDEVWSQKAAELIEQCESGGAFADLDGYRQKWHTEFERRASLKRSPFF